MAELVDAAALKAADGQLSWGFDLPLSHHFKMIKQMPLFAIYYNESSEMTDEEWDKLEDYIKNGNKEVKTGP